jgi:hypothetical protein
MFLKFAENHSKPLASLIDTWGGDRNGGAGKVMVFPSPYMQITLHRLPGSRLQVM